MIWMRTVKTRLKRIELFRASSEVSANSQESHQVGNERVASPVDDLEERSQERQSDNTAHDPTFNSIRDEQFEGRLVESVAFFDDKGTVKRERYRGDR